MKEKIKKVLFGVILAIIISFGFFEIKRYYILNKSYEFKYQYHTQKDFDKLIKNLESKKQDIDNLKPGMFDEGRTDYLKDEYNFRVKELKDIKKSLNKGKIKTKDLYNVIYTISELELNNSYRIKVLSSKKTINLEKLIYIGYSNYYLVELSNFNVANANELYIPHEMDQIIYGTFENYSRILDFIIEEGAK